MGNEHISTEPARDIGQAEIEPQTSIEIQSPPAPQRAVRFQLDLGADSRKAVLEALSNIEYMISTGQLTSGVSGGCDSGYSYKYKESDRPTPEEYREQLMAYLDAKR